MVESMQTSDKKLYEVVLDNQLLLQGEICKRKRCSYSNRVIAAFFLAEDIEGNKKMVKLFSRKSESKMKEFDKEIETYLFLSELERYVLLDYWYVSFEVLRFQDGEVMTDFNYIVYPFCERGSLLDLLMKMNKKHVSLSAQAQQYFCSELVKAVQTLQTYDGVAHRDIKPDNVVLANDCTLQLIDFALTESLKVRGVGSTGTYSYNPKEIYSGRSYDNGKVDIFQLGVTLYIILNQAPPFKNSSDSSYRERLFKLQATYLKEQQGGASELIYRCLSPNPADRPTIDQVLNWPYIRAALQTPTQAIVDEVTPYTSVDLI